MNWQNNIYSQRETIIVSVAQAIISLNSQFPCQTVTLTLTLPDWSYVYTRLGQQVVLMLHYSFFLITYITSEFGPKTNNIFWLSILSMFYCVEKIKSNAYTMHAVSRLRF